MTQDELEVFVDQCIEPLYVHDASSQCSNSDACEIHFDTKDSEK